MTILGEAFAEIVAAIVLGVGISPLLSQSRLLERGLHPRAVSLQTMSVAAVALLIVAWFGCLSVIIIRLLLSIFSSSSDVR